MCQWTQIALAFICLQLVSSVCGAVFVDVKILSVNGQPDSASVASSLAQSFKSGLFTSVKSVPILAADIIQASPPPADASVLKDRYDHCILLNEQYNYKLMWKISKEKGTIQVAQQADVSGWTAFGLSSNGKMISDGSPPGSDIILSYVSDGNCASGCVNDYSAVRYEQPALDTSLDVGLVSGGRAGKTMAVEWVRNLVTNDSVTDRPILIDTNTTIIWAINTAEAPTSFTSFSKHSIASIGGLNINFGNPYSCDNNAVLRLTVDTDKYVAKSLAQNIMETLNTVNNGTFTRLTVVNISDAPTNNHTAFCPDCIVYDMKMKNYQVPGAVTSYVCTGFTVPVSKKHHIIRFEPIVDNTLVLHHIVGYRANAAWSEGVVTTCDGMPTAVQPTPIYAWAPGGTTLDLPAEVGFPSGPESSDQIYYVIIQLHYNNPTKKTGFIDNSGVRIYLSPDIRKYDGGFLFLGVPTKFISVPAAEKNWHVAGVCPSTSTSAIATLPEKKLRIFSIAFHAHLIGKSLWTEVIRNNESIPLKSMQNYDFNSQSFYPIDFDLLPGDSLITHCVWDSTSRTTVTKGGEATTNEMCLAPILYYPNVNVGSCSPLHTEGIQCDYPCFEQPFWKILSETVKNSAGRNTVTIPVIIGTVIGVVVTVAVTVFVCVYREKRTGDNGVQYSRVPLE